MITSSDGAMEGGFSELARDELAKELLRVGGLFLFFFLRHFIQDHEIKRN